MFAGPPNQTQSASGTEQLGSVYIPTGVGENGVVTHAGTVLVVQQDHILALAASIGCYPSNLYKSGGRIKLGFIQNCGRRYTPADQRRLQVGDRVYLTSMEVKSSEIVFKVQSCGNCDPSNIDPENVPYRAALSFEFQKGYLDTANLKQIRETIDLVFGIGTPQAGAPHVQTSAVRLKLPASYFSTQNPADQLQLNSDNSFSLQESGQAYHGNFTINGSTLEITITDTGIKTPMTIQGSNLSDPSGQTWALREQPTTTASSGGALRNEDVIKMAKVGIDDGIIISKIKSSRTQFDTSPDALIALKTSGVSSAVLRAMTEPSSQPQTELRSQPAASGAGLPASYGGFVFDGTQYQPLAPAKISVVVGLRLRTGGNGFAVDGFSGEPPQSPVAAPSQLLIYQQNVDIASVHLARLVLIRSLQAYQFNIATATVNPNPSLYPSLFGVQYNQVIPVNLWRPLQQGVTVRTEPVVERNGMFRLIADAPLPPGKYALYFSDSVHTSDIVFTANGASGTAYYFEVRPGR